MRTRLTPRTSAVKLPQTLGRMINRRQCSIGLVYLATVSAARAGAWGPGSFENDGALDWILEFEKTPTPELVRASLSRVMTDGVVESMDGQAALAAAEVVAAASLGTADHLPREIQGRVVYLAPSLKALVPLAVAATRRVAGTKSELAELWRGREDSRIRWEEQVRQLLRRLGEHAA